MCRTPTGNLRTQAYRGVVPTDGHHHPWRAISVVDCRVGWLCTLPPRSSVSPTSCILTLSAMPSGAPSFARACKGLVKTAKLPSCLLAWHALRQNQCGRERVGSARCSSCGYSWYRTHPADSGVCGRIHVWRFFRICKSLLHQLLKLWGVSALVVSHGIDLLGLGVYAHVQLYESARAPLWSSRRFVGLSPVESQTLISVLVLPAGSRIATAFLICLSFVILFWNAMWVHPADDCLARPCSCLYFMPVAFLNNAAAAAFGQAVDYRPGHLGTACIRVYSERRCLWRATARIGRGS